MKEEMEKPGLVLSRYVGQSIVITSPSGDVIEITNTRQTSSKTRLHISAPRNYDIKRKEVLENEQQATGV